MLCCAYPHPATHTLISVIGSLKLLDEGDHTAWGLGLAPFTQHNILEITHIAGRTKFVPSHC